jgi:hypothetical protein
LRCGRLHGTIAAVRGHHPDGSVDDCDAADCRAAAHRGDLWVGPYCSVEPDGTTHLHHEDRLERMLDARRGDASSPEHTPGRRRQDPLQAGADNAVVAETERP